MRLDERSLGSRLAEAARANTATAAGDADRLATIDALVLLATSLTAIGRAVRGAPSTRALQAALRSHDRALRDLLGEGLATLGLVADWDAIPAIEAAVRALLAGEPVEAWAAIDESAFGRAREESLQGPARRLRGAHSTPAVLAAAIAAEALDVWSEAIGRANGPCILDPTAGGGALLLAAARSMVAAASARPDEAAELRWDIAKHRLFGVELDAATAKVARAAIALFGSTPGVAPPIATDHILTGDVLLSMDGREVSSALEVAGALDDDLAEDVANALVDAFFAVPPAARANERAWRIALARRAIGGEGAAREALAAWSAAGRARGAVHPSLRWRGRSFDLALLNPPFLGGKRIATVHGARYAAWLAAREPAATGNADLAAHVLLATRRWCSASAVVGFVATNSLAEGATREAGLERLVREGFSIRSAERSAPWPGVASVSVVRATLLRGGEAPRPPQLDGRQVAHIDAGLRAMGRRAAPLALPSNEGLGFIGCFLRGEGFVVSPEEARALLARGPENAACLRPYLVGRDVLRDPQQSPARWVIDFGERSLEEAAELPTLLAVVEARVRPMRERLPESGTNRCHRAAWWRFANARPELRRAVSDLATCFVAPRVAKHLTFARVSTAMVFSEQLVVVASESLERLGALASSVHEAWARAHSSSLQAGLRYVPSRALATFPFPAEGAFGLAEAAGALLEAQQHATREHAIGLTRLRDREHEPRPPRWVHEVVERRAELDRLVLAAYGWSDLVAPRPSEGAAAREAFAIAVVPRLASENERRGNEGASLV